MDLSAIVEIAIFCCLYIAGCDYALRGGTTEILDGKTPAPHIIAALATPLYLAPFLNLVLGITGYKLGFLCLIHAAFWFLTIMSTWQQYFSIGKSLGIRRQGVGWIDFVLDYTFGPILYDIPRMPKHANLWWIGRDGFGMFLRMCHALGLFLAVGLFLHLGWHTGLLAIEYTAVFAFVTVLIYGGYNWIPFIPHGDDKLNLSEFITGIWFAAIVFRYISIFQ